MRVGTWCACARVCACVGKDVRGEREVVRLVVSMRARECIRSREARARPRAAGISG